MKAPLEGWLDGCSCSYGKGSVGAHIMRPCQFSGSATPCGLVPIAAIRLHVGAVPPTPRWVRVHYGWIWNPPLRQPRALAPEGASESRK